MSPIASSNPRWIGAELNLKPLSVAVLDAGGHLIAFQKQDGSSMLRFEIAFGKAYGALAVGSGSRWLNAAAAERVHFVQALSGVSGGKIVPVPGGVLIRGKRAKPSVLSESPAIHRTTTKSARRTLSNR